MRVCFVSFFSYPLFNRNLNSNFGGAEVQLFNIANELVKKEGIDVDVIVGDYGQNNEEIVNGIRLIKSVRLENKPGVIKKIKSVFSQLFAFFKSGAEIYVQRSAGLQTGLVALYCTVFRKKFVYMTAHEWDCSGEYVRNNGFAGKLYKLGLKNADLVITQNQEQKQTLKEKFDIPSVILKSGFKQDIKKSILKKDYVLWVARLDEWKQPEIFIELAKRLPKIKFIMIAPSSNDKKYSEKIKKEADEISNMRFIPGLSFDETNNFFREARLFVNTSKYEGFPNTFMQATIYGTPILSTNVNPENILKKNNIGYCSSDISILEDKINLLFENDNVYKTMSANCLHYFSKNHNIEDIAERFFQFIKNRHGG